MSLVDGTIRSFLKQQHHFCSQNEMERGEGGGWSTYNALQWFLIGQKSDTFCNSCVPLYKYLYSVCSWRPGGVRYTWGSECEIGSFSSLIPHHHATCYPSLPCIYHSNTNDQILWFNYTSFHKPGFEFLLFCPVSLSKTPWYLFTRESWN